MTRKRFGTRRGLFSVPSTRAVPVLPRVGPFASLAPVPIAPLPNLTQSGGLLAVTSTNTRTNPFKYKNFVINTEAQVVPDLLTTAAIFLWADTVQIVTTGGLGPSVFDFSGYSGTDGQIDCSQNAFGGSGADGGSGGGGGSTITNQFNSAQGGEGGTGVDGNPGFTSGCCGSFPGVGGDGFGTTYNSGFTYPTGGNGGDGGLGSCAQTYGLGGNGFGGGGGGGGAYATGGGCGCCCGCGGPLQSGAGAGGGAGGGLIVIVCNTLSGTGQLLAPGGRGGNGGGHGGGGGGGGGGSILVYARHYTGALTVNVDGGTGGSYEGCATGNNGDPGTAKIFQINADNSTTLKAFNQSW